MILKELFNQLPRYKIVKANEMALTAAAMVNGRQIRFYAVKDGLNEWELSFGEVEPRIGDGGAKITFSKTGRGGEIQIFSMLHAFTKEVISRYAPKEIHFTGERSRRGAYEKMFIKRRSIPDYSFTITPYSDKSDIYYLRKE